VLPHGQNAREFVAMYQAGVPLAELLRSATVNAARAFGLDSLGQIGQGMVADLVALGTDPREDVMAYQKVKFVMSRGSVVVAP
jgi:imidazolonepropionase-like amidohydrolase